MHGESDGSKGPRIVMVALHAAGATFATDLLLGDGSFLRGAALVACAWVYFARSLLTTFYILERRVSWSEAVQVGPFVFAVQAGLGYLGSRASAPLGPVDWLAIALYVVGSGLNTVSELQRKAWKAIPENRGHLYTGGLFSWSMHVNYLGDVVLFTGFALLTHSPWALLLPAVMAAGFVLAHIPRLDRYLREKYGKEFEDWERTTSRFVPFLY